MGAMAAKGLNQIEIPVRAALALADPLEASFPVDPLASVQIAALALAHSSAFLRLLLEIDVMEEGS